MTVKTWHYSKSKDARMERVPGVGRVLIARGVSGAVGVGSRRMSVYVDVYADGRAVHATVSSYAR